MKTLRRFVFTFARCGGWLTVIIFCGLLFSSCGAGYHLRRAEYHKQKAIDKGVLIEVDTVYQKKTFRVPGVEIKYIPRLLSTGKTMIFSKDSVITKIKIVQGKNHHDTIQVQTKCPDVTLTKIIPVVVKEEIKAGKGFGYWLQWIVLGAVVGGFGGFIFRGKLV